ncbi:hypothetical protein BCR33DRAFT_724755 [Rhizoclosmatium globosum]|uniref:PLP-dependent transferase n=1 Tax=Rhizoclosmatium globosum TaxID=329046 RepID=A0A1Y2B356_9FUNG|nr:hypothetical protein BCR33DRAFT_724755 [Rhizoclosmatium globosum]|eukprot:ORY29251.1 hypothetical protein BCR33DRAFT_724755 [Rhizoclosmatium globosum]
MTRFSGPAPAFGTPEMRSEFLLDPSYIATNHGSFGAPPRKVLEERARITLEIEANPDLFCKVNYHHELNAALEPILSATGRHPIPSSLRTQKILYFSTVYGNVLNGINYTSSNDAFSSIQLQITYPISTKSILPSSNPQSQPNAQTETTLLKPDFFVTNLHKWLYVPRGAAVFYCARRFHGVIRHPVISEYDPKDWKRGFHWVGTTDVSPYLTAPFAIEYRKWIGGEDAIIKYCHDLAVSGGRIVAERLGTSVLRGVLDGEDALSGDDLYASMVNVAVPDTPLVTEDFMNKLQVYLLQEFKAGTAPYKHGDKYYLRLSAQVYLNEQDFVKLADVLYTVFYGKQ